MFDKLQGENYFSKIVLGYHQLRVRGVDIPKMSFHTRYSHYEFLVMSFGLTNVPMTFMDLMNKVFHNYLNLFVIVFLHGILIYPKNEDEHTSRLSIVCKSSRNTNFSLNIVSASFL